MIVMDIDDDCDYVQLWRFGVDNAGFILLSRRASISWIHVRGRVSHTCFRTFVKCVNSVSLVCQQCLILRI